MAGDNPSTQVSSEILTDGILIAAVTALAYLAAFMYEAGYCGHFGIPTSFITPSLTSVLTAAAAVGAVLYWTLIFALPWVSHLLLGSEHPAARPYRLVLRLAAGWLLVTIAFVVLYGWDWLPLLIITAFIWLPYVLSFFFTWLRDRSLSISELFTKHAGIQERDRGYAFVDRLVQPFGQRGTQLLGVSLIAVAVANLAGHAAAMREKEFLVLKGSPEIAVLRNYGDLVIAARVDRQARSVSREFHFFWLSEKKVVEFKLEPIGPLSAARRTTAAPSSAASSGAADAASAALSARATAAASAASVTR